MGKVERLKNRATKAWENGNLTRWKRIDTKRTEMQLPKLTAALQTNSPYTMYGKKSDPMFSESPLAKNGCSKKYKRGK